MIYSNKQYSISSAELKKLKTALAAAEARETTQFWLKQAEIDAFKSQIAEIEAELSEYKLVKSGQISFSKTYALEELPRILVQARIAAGLSQTDLAHKLNMKPQQIQRYEATDYMGASLSRLIEVSRVLGVKTSGLFEGSGQATGSVFVWNDVKDIAWGEFPYREMIDRKWFSVSQHENPLEKAKEYFLVNAGPQFATAYHRKKMRGGSLPNEYALLAWQARILEKAQHLDSKQMLADFQFDDRWLPELVSLTKCTDGPRQANELLAEKGIALVLERQLSGSYLDGAAMMSETGRPIIGLTLRYDRLDNFWFVLLHEIGHIFLHLLGGIRFDFFDEEGHLETDTIEAEADRFALNTLIPESAWELCLSRFALSEEAVTIDAEQLGLNPCIIAGRIRKERRNYSILSALVGQDKVRLHFEGTGHDTT